MDIRRLGLYVYDRTGVIQIQKDWVIRDQVYMCVEGGLWLKETGIIFVRWGGNIGTKELGLQGTGVIWE